VGPFTSNVTRSKKIKNECFKNQKNPSARFWFLKRSLIFDLSLSPGSREGRGEESHIQGQPGSGAYMFYEKIFNQYINFVKPSSMGGCCWQFVVPCGCSGIIVTNNEIAQSNSIHVCSLAL